MQTPERFTVRTNFDGAGVPERIKELIRNTPTELFYKQYSKQPNVVYNAHDESSNLDTKSTALTKSESVLLHNEISDPLVVNNRATQSIPESENSADNRSTETLEREKQIQAEKELEEKKKQEYIENVVKPRERKIAENLELFVNKLTLLEDQLLKEPPDSLLANYYDPNHDHPLTLTILNGIEKDGAVPAQTRDEIVDDDSAIQQFMEQRRKERESSQNSEKQKKITIDVALPDVQQLQKKSYREMKLELINMDEEKKRLINKLEQAAKLERLKIAIDMKSKLNFQNSEQWTDYLTMNYIKPEEQKIKETIQEEKNEKELTQGVVQRALQDFIQEKLVQQYIRSKL